MAGKLAVLASSPADYQRLGLSPASIDPWEEGEPVAATTRYTYQDGMDRYVVAFTRTHDLAATRMIDAIKGVRRIAARPAHFDGAYLWFGGDIEISRYRGSEPAETYKDDAIWELMYFGRARDQ